MYFLFHAKLYSNILQGTTMGDVVTFLRCTCVLATLLTYVYYDVLQGFVNITWSWLLRSPTFNSVYFETWWTTLCYAVILAIPWIMDTIPSCRKYQISPQMRWQSVTLCTILIEAMTYCTPLMTLDTFMMKKYHGVEPAQWEERRTSWIQTTRALPKDPPALISIILELIFSFIIYDALFFAVHFTLHKNAWLYKHVHRLHHEHDVIYSRVTNQLSVPERVVLVLTANEALKIVRGHPLTRTLFVPLFIAALVDNHSGFDLPCTWDKLVPWGLVGGSRRHYDHHVHGTRHYQPFFTYIDLLLSYRSKKAKD